MSKKTGHVIGTAAMEAIMAVEGIYITAADEALLDEIKQLPEDEKQKRILEYVKKRPS